MTREEAIIIATGLRTDFKCESDVMVDFCNTIIKALKQEPIDKSAMMHEIYMEGVNMSGEYQGCWVRFKNIEKIVDKYMAESEE